MGRPFLLLPVGCQVGDERCGERSSSVLNVRPDDEGFGKGRLKEGAAEHSSVPL